MPKNDLKQPLYQLVYGSIVYWMSVVAALICTFAPLIVIAFPARNVLDPHFVFSAIWAGKKPDAVWQAGGTGFPGGHFWLQNLTSGDALIQLGIVIGCICAGLGLLGASIVFIKNKPHSWGWAAAAMVIVVFIILATVGIYQQSA